jgi:hypothetical protein
MSGWADRTHGDAGTLELLADCAPMNAQLGSNLAEGPTLGAQVARMLNVHRATVTSLSSGCRAVPVTLGTRSLADGR